MRSTATDRVLSFATGLATLAILAVLGAILVQVVYWGAPAIDVGFLTGSPTADMTGGGIWPAIYGTLLMTLLMTAAVVPVGVATGIYLSEYAPTSSRLAALVRAAVINLAGVPSIVFGLFGLGFFVLFLGSGIDSLFYEPGAPVWGKPAVIWSSLTLAILTMPVVIVTTEEALRSVPRELRDASLALGATRFQTVFRVALPNALPGILTGAILAISRGAGEVAPIIFT
ncbi:MAG: phosphate ABC transporter permease PstA, partial [Sandaracinaceae bacterium]|nr:phosphate ABC transporter permease PstA [Sandaracinaceae bacterium]